MPMVGFREKQYENAANMELASQDRAVFPPDQVLEAVLAYDVAARQPQDAPVWKLLKLKAPPGILLSPNLWQRGMWQPKPADLPSVYVSVIFQYKRPMRIERSNGNQWHFWSSPYYRFGVTPQQHLILLQLESDTGGRAIVRYAAPAFSSYEELQQYQLNEEVLKRSAFAAPSDIGSHTIWTYSGAGIEGRGNPDGESKKLQSFKDLWRNLKITKKRESLFEHLRGIASGLDIIKFELISNVDFEMDDLQDGMTPQQRQGVIDVLQITSLTSAAAASWYVADMNPERGEDDLHTFNPKEGL